MHPPATYLPFLHARYDIAPGLSRLGRDFGNGIADRQHFQIDDQRPRYRAAKADSFARSADEHYATHGLDPLTRLAMGTWIAAQLASEHPSHFSFSEGLLTSSHDGKTIDVSDPGTDALHVIAMRVQEDLAIVRVEDDRDWMALIHLCLPNHWNAAQKIGRSFFDVHAPVAGIEPINRRAAEFARLMVNATEGLVRFAWGIATDDRLPHPPNDPLPARSFNRMDPAAWVRVERQTIRGFPEVGAALFTIRTYLLDVRTMARPHQHALAGAVRSMSDASLRYKGLAGWRDDLLDWLER